mmetsp:Transcript_36071/g.114664  ORF Transcript_36071/g.114664 Transcript_36071/m.114664 type:complete len:245 (-) Transcript_36071:14-748(-)
MVSFRPLANAADGAAARLRAGVRRLRLRHGRIVGHVTLAERCASTLEVGRAAQLQRRPGGGLGHLVRVEVRGVGQPAGVGGVVISSNNAALLLHPATPVRLPRGVQAAHVAVQEARVQSLLGSAPLALAEVAVVVLVEAAADEVVELADHAVAVKVVAGIRHASLLPRLLELTAGADRWAVRQPPGVTDVLRQEVRLVLEGQPVVLVAVDVIVWHWVLRGDRHGSAVDVALLARSILFTSWARA